MNPQQKHQRLYFTPRTPWGTRLTGRSFFDHLKASDAVPLTGPGEKPKLSGKELQGLGGGMAPNQLGSNNPQGLSGQISQSEWGNTTPQELSGQRIHSQLSGKDDKNLDVPSHQPLPPEMQRPVFSRTGQSKGPMVTQTYGPRLNDVYTTTPEKRRFRLYAGVGANGSNSHLEEVTGGIGVTNGEREAPEAGPKDPETWNDRWQQYTPPEETEHSSTPNPYMSPLQNPFNQPFQTTHQEPAQQQFSPSNPPAQPFKEPFDQKTPAPPTLQSSPFNQSFQPNRLKPKFTSQK